MSAARAVVVMGKVPRPGRVKTRLAKRIGARVASDLYRVFLQDVFAVVDAAAAIIELDPVFSCALGEGDTIDQAKGLAPMHWAVADQTAGDLGARIESARRCGAARYTLVMGSDAPTMPPARIVEAFELLEREGIDAVVGPTVDGGYDLIAFDGARPALLDGIPWSTPGVLKATAAAAERAGIALRQLDEGYDVDHFDDLPRALEDAERSGSLAGRTAAAIREVLRSLD